MGFWGKKFGKESKDQQPRSANISVSSVTDIIDDALAADVPKILREALLSIKPSGVSEFVHDRLTAKKWYTNQKFYVREYDEIGTRVYEEMALRADDKSIWKEAWALVHHTLSGYTHLGDLTVIPAWLWRLGRSHMGLRNQSLSNLYLETAYLLYENKQDIEMAAQALAELVVLAALFEDQSTYQEAMDRLNKMLASNNQGNKLTRETTLSLFTDGEKNANWLDKEDKPIPLCLDLARSYFDVCLELNRKTGDKEGIGYTLFWLGDVWYKLKENNKAEKSWRESLSTSTKLNDDELHSVVTARLELL